MKRWYLLLAVLLAPVRLSAQQQQPDFSGFQTSLSQVKTSIGLEMLDRARRSDSLAPGPLVERGLIALRRYEITSRRQDSNRARQLFGNATDRYPMLPWAHYGLGIALAHGPDVRIKSPLGVLNKIVVGQTAAQIVGLDPRSRAKRSLRRALELDPLFASAAIELADLALQEQDKGGMETARDALARITAHGSPPANVSTALSNVEAALGNVDAASSAADAAIAKAPNDASALHARAVALLLKKDDEQAGAQAYFAAVDQLTPEAADEFFHDVIALVSDSEHVAWDSGNLAAHKTWLKSFWDMRSARAGITVPERLAEHYRRLSVAQQKYRRKSSRGGDPAEAVVVSRKKDKLEYDDRGVIYIRHGDPAEIVSSHSVNLRPNETWVYRTPDGKNELLHFIMIRNTPDFRLVDNIFQAVDMTTTGFNTTSTVQLLEDRVAYDPRYALMIAKLRNTRTAVVGGGDAGEFLTSLDTQARMIQAENHTQALTMLSTDTDRPRFDRDLPFYYDVYAFRGKNGRTDLTAAIAIPGEIMQPIEVNGVQIYSVRLSLIVIDSLRGRVERADTLFKFRSRRPLARGENLRTQVDLTVDAAKGAAHRLVASNPGGESTQGAMYGGAKPIPDFRGAKLMVSDIVLAEPETGGAWKRGDLHLRLVPPRQFAQHRPLSLFYEVYNLPAGTRYRTEIGIVSSSAGALSKLKGIFGGTSGVHFSFEGTAAADSDGAVQELRRLAPDLAPGKYKLSVKVTNLTNNETIANEREFVVMK
jgi:tetratricopeptide (TPR) repeat protein